VGVKSIVLLKSEQRKCRKCREQIRRLSHSFSRNDEHQC